MTSLNPFTAKQGAYSSIGKSFSVVLGKMLDGGREIDPLASALPYIRAGNIQDAGLDLIDVNTMLFTVSEAEALDLRQDDVLVVEGGAVGTCFVLTEDLPGWSFQKTVNRVRPIGPSSSKYLAFVLRAYRDAGIIDILCNKSTIPHLTAEKLRALPVPSWTPPKQRAIADFLDRQTAQIDTLIEEQQRLIEMLQAKRADLIRGTVLGNLNPLSPNKTERLTAVGHQFSVTLGKMLDGGKAAPEGSELLPYIRAGNIQDSGLRLEDVNSMPFSGKEAADLNLLSGDLLVAEGGAVGTNIVLSTDMPGWSFQKTVNRVRPLNNGSSAWLGYVLRTYRDLGVIDIICNRSTIAHLTAEKLRALRIPDCEVAEQRRIVNLLDEQTARIDDLIAETEKFIELSRERRSALITAAVTGQIDVRDKAA